MFEILNKQILAQNIKRIDVHAPQIASKAAPGQFVSVCPAEGDEQIPLTVIDWDAARGSISLIFHEVGKTTQKLGSIPIHESIFSILGPLGTPGKIEKKGTVVCIATGIGAAQILPICRALKDAGNKIIGVMGAKTKRSLMLEAQMRIVCNKIFITTNDGSYERKGLATDILKDLIAKEDIQFVYAIGAVDMMKEVSALTKERNIETRVQLKPVMIDCMGMCGACRVKVGRKNVLSCIEGPEFDGHKVDFDDLALRMKAYKETGGCHHPKTKHNRQTGESGILMKFLSGFLNK